MRTASFALAALAAVANAGKVHEFMAESHQMCQLCHKVMNHTANKQFDELEKLYSQFPALLTRINSFHEHLDLINVSEPEASCININLCESHDVEELLKAEQVLDLQGHINRVNSNPNATWVAGDNVKFTGASLKEVRQMMGTVVDPEWTAKIPVKSSTVNADTLPESFDVREAWPECADLVGFVRDQSACGGCWAHGSTESFNDRKCIATGGAFQTRLSIADTLACCDGDACFSYGCHGGQTALAWAWFIERGVVSGNGYGYGELCYDYLMPRCSHHVDVPGMEVCTTALQVEPVCYDTCHTNSAIDYEGDKKLASDYYHMTSVEDTKRNIMQFGSITTSYTVYSDFLTYKSGVYRHLEGNSMGGHAVKTIGWGIEDGVEYWICVNSWNETWGDGGLFKIAFGECYINNGMYGGEV